MKPRILIVEDEPLMARIIGQQIEGLGYDLVATTAYGEEALVLAGELELDLAIVDLSLAGEMDGITTSIALRERFGRASILITAAPNQKLIERAIGSKPYGYLQKPFTPQELQLAIAMAQQRLQTESSLRQREEQHETVLRTSMDSFWIVDIEGHILDINDAACHVTGFSRAELLKMSIADLEVGRTPPQIAEGIKQVLVLGSVQMERQVRCKGGEVRLIEMSVTYSPQQRLFCFGRDITERRRGELALKDSEQNLRATLDSLPDAAWLKDWDGRYLSVNSVWCKMNDQSPTSVVGKTDFDLFPREHAAEYTRQDESVRQSLSPLCVEIEHKNKNGEIVCLEVRKTPLLDSNNQPTGLVGVARDVTGRKHADNALIEQLALRERLSKIAAIAPGVIYTFRLRPDGSSCLPYASPTIETIFGVRPGDLMENAAPFFDLIHPADRAPIYESIAESARTLLPWRMEFRLQHPTKGNFWVEGQSTPENQADGSVLWHGFISDVTARKHTEEILQKNEERLRMALHAGRLGAFEHTLLNDRVLLSPEFCEICGLSLQTSIPHDEWVALMHPDDRSRVAAGVQKMVREESALDIEYRTCLANGDVRWIRAMATPVVERGEVRCAHGVIQDITERKTTEASLRKLSRAVEQSPASIVVTNTQGDIEYVNPYFEKHTGYTRLEAIGKNPRVLNSGAHPKEFFKNLWETITAGNEWRGEIRNRRKDGTLYWEQASISPMRNEDGEIVNYIAVKEDVTERKANELAMAWQAALVENSADICCVKDLELGVLYANQAMARAAGVDDPAFLIGKTDAEIFGSPESNPHVRSFMEDERATQKLLPGQCLVREEVFRPAGRPERVMLTRKFPVFNWDGKLIATANISTDITETKQAERELIRAKDEAEAANRAKSAFLATMSHELRTPLNVINGMSALLAQEDWPTEHRHAIDLISEGGSTLLNIIEEILDYSGIQAGKTRLEETPFSVATVASSALRLCASSARTKGLNLTCCLDTKTPAEALGDPRRLRQILVNLLHNAIKFTEHGRIHLRMTALAATGGQHTLKFAIFDSGIGIAAENIAKLFRPFSQADDSITRRFGGTGLGLVITKSFINLMGGDISVRSRPNVGSVFKFQVKLKASGSQNTAFTNLAAPTFQKRRVLILGENGGQQRMLATLLRDWGMQPVVLRQVPTLNGLAYPDVEYDIAVLPLQPACEARHPLAAWLAQPGRGPKLPVLWFGRKDAVPPAGCTAPSARLGTHIDPAELSQSITDLLTATTSNKVLRDAKSGKPKPLAESIPLSILAAEDNQTNREVIKLVLRYLGYCVDLVENGAEAVAAVQNKKYDLLLLDMQMPVMDGLTAASEICRLIPDPSQRLKIVALTANALPEDRKRCLDAGMDAYLTKPIVPADLTACIRRIFRSVNEAPPVVAAPVKTKAAPTEVPWLDTAHLETISAGLPPEQSFETLRQLHDSVCNDFKDTFVSIVECCERQDQPRFAETIHGLKGCFMMIGWSRAGAFCAEALAAARKGEFKGWPTFADKLTATFALSSKTMSAYLEGQHSHPALSPSNSASSSSHSP